MPSHQERRIDCYRQLISVRFYSLLIGLSISPIIKAYPMLHSKLSLLFPSRLFYPFISLVFGICILAAYGNAKEAKDTPLTFSGPILPPASGNKPDSLVVLFHGYGDTGENFVLIGHLWRDLLPNTLFVAPNGPRACPRIPSGKQWVSSGNKNQKQILKELKSLTPSLNRYIDDLLKTYALPPEKLVLVGFSQGVKVALHAGLRRPCAGIVAYSGAFLDDPKEHYLSRPPVLLVHGMKDTKAPFSLAQEAEKHLKARHIPVTLFLFPQLGHEIGPREIEIGGAFLKDCLYGR